MFAFDSVPAVIAINK